MPGYNNYRNYIQDSLLSPLIAGKKYYVTFYVSLADTFKYACNTIGAYFSDSALVWSIYGNIKSYLHPQVNNDTAHNPLTNKVNWMKVSGSFVAYGGEQYIIIGNFVNDGNSDAVFVNSTNPSNLYAAYYYIDDVIVSTDSTYVDSLFTGVQTFKRSNSSANIYPNPSNGNVTIAITSTTEHPIIYLYNMLGQEVETVKLNRTQTIINNRTLQSGIYFYRVMNDSGIMGSGKLIIQK